MCFLNPTNLPLKRTFVRSLKCVSVTVNMSVWILIISTLWKQLVIASITGDAHHWWTGGQAKPFGRNIIAATQNVPQYFVWLPRAHINDWQHWWNSYCDNGKKKQTKGWNVSGLHVKPLLFCWFCHFCSLVRLLLVSLKLKQLFEQCILITWRWDLLFLTNVVISEENDWLL